MMWAHVYKLCTLYLLPPWSIVHLRPILGTEGCLSSAKRLAKPSIIRFLFVGLLEEMTAMISKKLVWNRVKNNETLNKNSRHLWTVKPFWNQAFFDGFPLYRAVKALHLQAIMTSRNKVVWLGVTVRLLIAQWCNIKKSSVFLILNMHIIRSSWQMLYFQCLIIRFYRFSLILPKRKKNYMSPHFMPLSVWNSWPWLESSHKTSLYWSYVSLNFQWNKGFYFQIMITKWMQSIPLLQLFQVGVSKVTLKNILRLFKWAPWVI